MIYKKMDAILEKPLPRRPISKKWAIGFIAIFLIWVYMSYEMFWSGDIAGLGYEIGVLFQSLFNPGSISAYEVNQSIAGILHAVPPLLSTMLLILVFVFEINEKYKETVSLRKEKIVTILTAIFVLGHFTPTLYFQPIFLSFRPYKYLLIGMGEFSKIFPAALYLLVFTILLVIFVANRYSLAKKWLIAIPIVSIAPMLLLYYSLELSRPLFEKMQASEIAAFNVERDEVLSSLNWKTYTNSAYNLQFLYLGEELHRPSYAPADAELSLSFNLVEEGEYTEVVDIDIFNKEDFFTNSPKSREPVVLALKQVLAEEEVDGEYIAGVSNEEEIFIELRADQIKGIAVLRADFFNPAGTSNSLDLKGRVHYIVHNNKVYVFSWLKKKPYTGLSESEEERLREDMYSQYINSIKLIDDMGEDIFDDDIYRERVHHTFWKSYMNEEYGFSLQYPREWRVGNNKIKGGSFQLFNYSESEDLNHSFSSGANKIEVVIIPRNLYYPTPESSVESKKESQAVVAGQEAIKTEVKTNSGDRWLSYRFAVPNSPDELFIITIYGGDTGNFYVLDEILAYLKWSKDN